MMFFLSSKLMNLSIFNFNISSRIMSQKNIANLMIESKYSKVGKQIKQNIGYKEYKGQRGMNNSEEYDNQSKIYRHLKSQLSQTMKELQKANECIKQYRQKEQAWRKHEDIFKQQINHLRNSILEIYEQTELQKHNYENQIQFYVKKQKQILTTLSTLLQTKQVQRMENFIQNELSHICLQSRWSNLICHSQSLVVENPVLDQFILNTHRNLKQISLYLTDLKRLPQMKNLVKEFNLTDKKLSWYLSQPPFQEGDKRKRDNICRFLIKNTNKGSGRGVFELILRLLHNNGGHELLEPPKRKSDITNFKSEMSELIETNNISRSIQYYGFKPVHI